MTSKRSEQSTTPASSSIDLLLQAIQRRAQAEYAYHRALADYARAKMRVGSIAKRRCWKRTTLASRNERWQMVRDNRRRTCSSHCFANSEFNRNDDR